MDDDHPLVKRGQAFGVLVLCALVAITVALFQAFEEFDFGYGVWRFFFLVGLGVLAAALRWAGTHKRISLPPPSRRFVAVVLLGFVMLIAHRGSLGVRSAWEATNEDRVEGDQGPNIYAAFTLLRASENPYGPTVMVDPVELDNLLSDPHAQLCLTQATSHYRDATQQFYMTYDDAFMPDVVDDVRVDSQCADVERHAKSLGFKYGPFMMVAHAPLLSLAGIGGLLWTHLVLFAVLVALTFSIAFRFAWGDARWLVAALAIIVLLAPTIVHRCTLLATDADLLPTVLSLAGLWCIQRRAPCAGAAFIALSIATKVLPGVLFVPLLMPTRTNSSRRPIAVVAALSVTTYLPFIVWNPEGLWLNLVRFNFSRPSDSTALADYVSPFISTAILVAVLMLLVVLIARAARRGWTTRRRLDFLLVGHIGALATGPILHNNYLVWLLPVFALFLSHEIGSFYGVPRAKTLWQQEGT